MKTKREKQVYLITGNSLLSGDVGYLNKQGLLVPAIQDAEIWSDKAQADAVCETKNQQSSLSAGLYVMPAWISGEGVYPVSFKEQIRLKGPTISLPLASKPVGPNHHATATHLKKAFS